MITIVYTDGSTDEFKSSKHLFVDDDDSDDDSDWLVIRENPKDTDDDEYDEDEDKLVAEIKKECIRKVQYD